MQTRVATCNHTEVKGNNIRSKSSIHDRNFPKFWRYFFSFDLCWIALFCFFEVLHALHKFELKYLTAKISVPMVIVLKYCFQILVFDKRQVKWLQTRKRKLQEEIRKSLDEVVIESFEKVIHSCSTDKMFWKFQKKFQEKCPCKHWDLQQKLI